ncbi:DUF294 nucleotidyltransferase-like domain-containing protein [Neobacillus citreus]|uniref:DUF294 nucleotidyltransferase-like domain-containing protein n=1 Tax=Neobacillus citreus TaxID=2833578 RepID=A0A942YCM6_9BACI|nr:DUF294 nucleotidyltransferase-like domain-containing protein [Neobacillus citreus]MCH6265576.1 DUF294 nucleotidyltransferase-like domain-containing protein [Neobacillus citreus]
MADSFYMEIRKFRDDKMKQASHDHIKLNQLHDEIMKKVIHLALKQTAEKLGPLPCPFTFFVMGSAGRFEQSIWSDQDHGIIYQDDRVETKVYFLELGKEISKGLFQAGYSYCDGGVMASNPLWCKSLYEWDQQLMKWILEFSWESVRYLLIFIDARTLLGDEEFVDTLKNQIYQNANKDQLVKKMLNNTKYLKNGINVFGKLVTETHGPYAGLLNIKEIGILPYVNAVRLIAIKENLLTTPTLERLDKLSELHFSDIDIDLFKHQFIRLLNFRLIYCNHTNYDSGHYLPVAHLSREQSKELKDVIKYGSALFHSVRKLIEKEDSHANE